jgi:DNA helicase II / ATP-dependent DNA helicase PcrA
MDKRVIFAVAGSGKTTFIISKLTLDKRFLLITYTDNNVLNLRDGIVKKFGYFPNNISLFSYFTFLYSFCFKPLLSDKIKSSGINWDQPPLFLKQSNLDFYVDRHKRLYHNRIAKLCEVLNILSDIKERIEKYYSYLFIDEIQDFAGHDFNFIQSITKTNCEILFVGDFYQHTFDTSNDGNVNKSLFDDYESYKKRFASMGLVIDMTSLRNSYRCSKTVCNFIKENIGIGIYSANNEETTIITVKSQSEADAIFKNNSIVKLFYKEHAKFGCYSQNWGSSKGINHFTDVCVVLNKTTEELFEKHQLSSLKPQTKNKFYVACSRARGKLFLISENFIKKYKVD